MNNAVFVTLGIPLVLYLGQAIQYLAQQGRYGMALTMAAYGIANIGLILDSKGI